MPQLLTADEVSEMLGISPARVYFLTRQRKLPFVQLGDRQYRYSESELMEWIRRGGNQEKESEDGK